MKTIDRETVYFEPKMIIWRKNFLIKLNCSYLYDTLTYSMAEIDDEVENILVQYHFLEAWLAFL